MKNFIIKLVLILIISFLGGFFDAFLKNKKIDATCTIFIMVGYLGCLIFNGEVF